MFLRPRSAGRILSGAGSPRNVTLFNCFVMGDVADDMTGIFDGLKEAALPRLLVESGRYWPPTVRRPTLECSSRSPWL